jgi:antitoxin component YwqK of YwqJK toxin-antitoxin module
MVYTENQIDELFNDGIFYKKESKHYYCSVCDKNLKKPLDHMDTIKHQYLFNRSRYNKEYEFKERCHRRLSKLFKNYTCETYHSNGEAEKVYVDHGDGKRDYYEYYDNGVLEEQYTTYYLFSISDMEYGIKHGEEITYNRKGIISSKSYYYRGLLEGESINYYYNGNVMKIHQYRKGELIETEHFD